MHKSNLHFSFSITSLCIGTVAVLTVVYIGLIATVMSYATLTVEFSQSVKNDESAIAVLEGQYLAIVARISTIDYVAEGYSIPKSKIFVKVDSSTALR